MTTRKKPQRRRRTQTTKAQHQELRKLIAENKRLNAERKQMEAEAAELLRTHASRGEMREALEAVGARLSAWLCGGDLEQRHAVMADAMGVASEKLPPILVDHIAEGMKATLRTARAEIIGDDPPDAERDFPFPRRSEVVAEMTESMWNVLLLAMRGKRQVYDA